MNEVGIELCNNSTHLIENEIGKSHENGIKITGNHYSQPKLWRNTITNCDYNGIYIQGLDCKPDIRGNTIKQNRKAGIKLTESAIAHIGGQSKTDVKIEHQLQNGKISDAKARNLKVEPSLTYNTP